MVQQSYLWFLKCLQQLINEIIRIYLEIAVNHLIFTQTKLMLEVLNCDWP